jgi:hypothetical protein
VSVVAVVPATAAGSLGSDSFTESDAYPHLRHYVFSRSLTPAPDTDVRIVAGDPV